MRKVVWRALLQQRTLIHSIRADPASGSLGDAMNTRDGTGMNAHNVRLGRLHDSVYTNWPAFVHAAGARVPLHTVKDGQDILSLPPSREEESPLEVLHVLRCLLGPLVESLIILDREAWVREALSGITETPYRVELVNLFDQATGSGRNIAIVVTPQV